MSASPDHDPGLTYNRDAIVASMKCYYSLLSLMVGIKPIDIELAPPSGRTNDDIPLEAVRLLGFNHRMVDFIRHAPFVGSADRRILLSSDEVHHVKINRKPIRFTSRAIGQLSSTSSARSAAGCSLRCGNDAGRGNGRIGRRYRHMSLRRIPPGGRFQYRMGDWRLIHGAAERSGGGSTVYRFDAKRAGKLSSQENAKVLHFTRLQVCGEE
jgi:hypothetical protein